MREAHNSKARLTFFILTKPNTNSDAYPNQIAYLVAPVDIAVFGNVASCCVNV